MQHVQVRVNAVMHETLHETLDGYISQDPGAHATACHCNDASSFGRLDQPDAMSAVQHVQVCISAVMRLLLVMEVYITLMQ